MAIFDSDLIASAPQASLAGIPFRINPQTVQLGYNLKTSQTQTVGGMVVQVYGVTLSDLSVEGYFGTGGRQEQQVFFNQIRAIAQATVDAQRVQPDLAHTGDDVVFSTGSVRFLFPLLNYDLQVYVKAYASIEGDAVIESNANFNPSWSLTLLIENDNTGLLTTTVANKYISRVAAGLGSGILVGGQINEYLGSNSADISDYLKNYGGGTGQTFAQIFDNATGSSAGSTQSSPSSVAPTTSSTGNEATVWKYFAAKGVSAIAAAGFMGNFQAESGFNPQAVYPNTTSNTIPLPLGTAAFGLAQWLSVFRQQGLQNLADNTNRPVDDLGLQLDFVWQELTTSYASTLAAAEAASSPAAAADVVNAMYEGSGESSASREAYAESAYTTYGPSTKTKT